LATKRPLTDRTLHLGSPDSGAVGQGRRYAITIAATSLLPGALDLPVTPVYSTIALALASANFLIFGGGVFHAEHCRRAVGDFAHLVTQTRWPDP